MNTYLNTDFSYLADGLKGDTMIFVTNMSRKRVSYILPEIHVERDFKEYVSGFQPDKKEIPFGELYALNNSPGGRQLIWDNLKIDSNVARKGLDLPLSDDVPEVEFSREDVIKILNDGTEAEILDMLEFGPYYIAELVKEEIISIDSSKRRAFVGNVFRISVDGLEENLKWASEDPSANGYSSIKGAPKKDASANTGTRRARRSGNNKKTTASSPQRRSKK